MPAGGQTFPSGNGCTEVSPLPNMLTQFDTAEGVHAQLNSISNRKINNKQKK